MLMKKQYFHVLDTSAGGRLCFCIRTCPTSSPQTGQLTPTTHGTRVLQRSHPQGPCWRRRCREAPGYYSLRRGHSCSVMARFNPAPCNYDRAPGPREKRPWGRRMGERKGQQECQRYNHLPPVVIALLGHYGQESQKVVVAGGEGRGGQEFWGIGGERIIHFHPVFALPY